MKVGQDFFDIQYNSSKGYLTAYSSSYDAWSWSGSTYLYSLQSCRYGDPSIKTPWWWEDQGVYSSWRVGGTVTVSQVPSLYLLPAIYTYIMYNIPLSNFPSCGVQNSQPSMTVPPTVHKLYSVGVRRPWIMVIRNNIHSLSRDLSKINVFPPHPEYALSSSYSSQVGHIVVILISLL